MFIKDISSIVTANSKLTADDACIYKQLHDGLCDHDSDFQKDLNNMDEWCQTWQLILTTRKCMTVLSSRKE